jgi:hypothetical protein
VITARAVVALMSINSWPGGQLSRVHGTRGSEGHAAVAVGFAWLDEECVLAAAL